MSDERREQDVVGGVTPRGDGSDADCAHGASPLPTNAASGDAAYEKATTAVGRRPLASAVVGRVTPHGIPDEPPPRRLRRLRRVWPDRDGNCSYLLTMCVDGRGRVLDNEITCRRFVEFLLDSSKRYHWFGRRFVVMPDHIHLIAHMGHNAVRLGQWVKALKAVVGGLERRMPTPAAASGDAAYHKATSDAGQLPPAGAVVGRVSPRGVPSHSQATRLHEFTRIKRAWRWQAGFHDHKFRTPESEANKWEYVCLNPVRAGLVKRPEEWEFGGEIFYGELGEPRLVRGVPPLLETGLLIEETPREGTAETPVEGHRPTT